MLPKRYALYFLLLLFIIFSLTAILFIRSNLDFKQRQRLIRQQMRNQKDKQINYENDVADPVPMDGDDEDDTKYTPVPRPASTPPLSQIPVSTNQPDIEHFVHHDKLSQQQERDDLLLQREREKMAKERLAMNKEPHVVRGSPSPLGATTSTPTAATMNNNNNNNSNNSNNNNNNNNDSQSGRRRLQSLYYDQLIVAPDEAKKDDNDKKLLQSEEEQEDESSSVLKICRNTVSGHEFVTDSRGYTCRISELSTRTMCCNVNTNSNNNDNNNKSQGEQQKTTTTTDTTMQKPSSSDSQEEDSTERIERYSCNTCHSQHQCCETYEYCVSCCLKPENRPQLEQLFSQYLAEKKLLYSRVQTVFQFCAARCRTNSNSVINENKYRTNLKHCFGPKDPANIFTDDEI